MTHWTLAHTGNEASPLETFLNGLDNGFDADALKAKNLLEAAPDLLAVCEMFNHPGIFGMIGNAWGRDKMLEYQRALSAALRNAKGPTCP